MADPSGRPLRRFVGARPQHRLSSAGATSHQLAWIKASRPVYWRAETSGAGKTAALRLSNTNVRFGAGVISALVGRPFRERRGGECRDPAVHALERQREPRLRSELAGHILLLFRAGVRGHASALGLRREDPVMRLWERRRDPVLLCHVSCSARPFLLSALRVRR